MFLGRRLSIFSFVKELNKDLKDGSAIVPGLDERRVFRGRRRVETEKGECYNSPFGSGHWLHHGEFRSQTSMRLEARSGLDICGFVLNGRAFCRCFLALRLKEVISGLMNSPRIAMSREKRSL